MTDDENWLEQRFAEYQATLRAVAYRMLGSQAEADDAVQDAWVRVCRASTGEIENLHAWLTTVVARVCLNRLRARNIRQEQSLDTHIPDPVIAWADTSDPAEEAVLADSVGLALLVVLDTLAPAERLAFVLHDMFDVPFEEIAVMIGRSAVASRQLASRARRRIKGADVQTGGADLNRQRQVVDAFFAATREGDFDALVALLDPDVVLRIDGGASRPSASKLILGAAQVASEAARGLTGVLARPATHVHPVMVNGFAGVVVTVDGQPVTIMGFTVRAGLIVEIDSIADPARVVSMAGSFDRHLE